MANTEPKRLTCPIRPSQRPCLHFIPVPGYAEPRVTVIKGGPECQKTGRWCEAALPRVPKDSLPLILRPKKVSTELPSDVDAEEAVLGALLLAGEWDEVAPVYSFLKASDFYQEKNGWVYEALSLRHKQGGLDQVTVAHALGDRLQEVGGRVYLSYLVSRVPTPYHAVPYAHIVKEMAERRRAIDRACRWAGEAWEGKIKPERPPLAERRRGT